MAKPGASVEPTPTPTPMPTPVGRYERKLMAVRFMFDGEEIVIEDTDTTMAATEAYNEYLRGGFIKLEDGDNASVLINASLIPGLSYSYQISDRDKYADEFCNVVGEGVDAKQGIYSISISPALETSPEIATLFPLYWDDIEGDDPYKSVERVFSNVHFVIGQEYTLTITPTSEWYASTNLGMQEKGQPASVTVKASGASFGFEVNVFNNTEFDDTTKGINVKLSFTSPK